MALYLLMVAIGAAISLALAGVSVDPHMVWLYSAVAIAAFISGCVFWFLFNHYNAKEDAMDTLDSCDPQVAVSVDELKKHRKGIPAGGMESEPVGETAA